MAAFVISTPSILRRASGAHSQRVSVAPRMVSTPIKTTHPKDAKLDPLAAPPPFSLEDIRKAIPEHLWKKDLNKSLMFMFRDVAIVFGLATAAVLINNPAMWLFYYFAQGTMMWALFVVGHDCGHGSFSNSTALNNLFGHITHGSILVPFHGWRISHRTHHANHGHVENDESWYPSKKSEYDALEFWPKAVRYELPLSLIAYQLYLFRRSPGKEGSHFDPSCDLFRPSERNYILQSTSVCVGMIALLTGLAIKFGFLFVLNTYLIPHTIFCAWLVAVTYLHHTDDSLPWYRDGEWTYLRGGLTTLDKDYGIFNNLHHDIGTHVVHHLYPQMPHYNIVEATEAIKPVLGDYYRKPEKSGFFPFHLVRDMINSFRNCRYVEDEGKIVYYKRED